MKNTKLTNIGLTILGATLAIFSLIAWINSSELFILISEIVVSTMAIFSILAMGASLFIARFWYVKKCSELRRDNTLATNEEKLSNLNSQREEMRLIGEGRVMAATIRTVENGLLHANSLSDISLSTFPAQIINQAVPLLESAQPKALPARVNLNQLMTEKPTLNNLILGVGEDDKIITESLKSLTHVAVAGSTRWGKSIFIQMLLYQIALAKEETKLYLADLGGTTFCDFGLPYASDLSAVESMVSDVMSEAETRKALYKATGRGIKSLDMYNHVTGENLPHIVLIIDEALYLMEKSKTIKENLEIAVSWAAKYGITVCLISQDFKANVIATSTRNNFSSRFQFLAEDKTQASILVKGCDAHNIENKGRCFSRLPGNREIIELQTPFVSEDEIMAIAPHIQSKSVTVETGPTGPLSFVVAPEETEPDTPSDEEMKAIESFVTIRDSGKFSWRKATEEAYGPGKFGKDKNIKLRSTLDKFGIDYSEYISE